MHCCKNIPTASIQLTQGDDSNALGHYIKITLKTELDLTGWRAVFQLENFQWEYNDLTTGEINLVFPRNITSQLTLGTQYGALKIFDANMLCRTIVKNIPFFINKISVVNTLGETNGQ